MQPGDRVEPAGERILAWDLPTRLFHWTLVALIATAWASFEFSERIGDPVLKLHRWNGIAILVLVVWRVLWGVLGSRTARFSEFVRGPRSAFGYLAGLFRGTSRRYLGHNPAGAYMVLALLTIVGTEALLGLFTVEHNDLTAGPLYRLLGEDTVKQVSRVHRMMFDKVLLPFVVVHIAVNILYGVIKRDPLIPAMITGRKPAADYADAVRAGSGGAQSLLRAATLLAVSAALVLGTIKGLGGRLP
ncbi:MAG: cytochrome b/b6 domain-containing protein [Hyphomicrobiaceae bacterium]|nr:cytochrome b/b6 domain-containing protein [Hyphomicrobiaceae bacterium]